MEQKITVYYNRIEAAEDNYFSNIYDNIETMLISANTTGSFESNDLEYHWELLEKIENETSPLYMFSLVKESKQYPVHITDNGRSELIIKDGKLGDISHGLFCPAYQFILCFVADSGGSATQFKKLFGQFTPEGVVRFNPVFEDNIEEKVLLWDSYKKLSISMIMPSESDIADLPKLNPEN